MGLVFSIFTSTSADVPYNCSIAADSPLMIRSSMFMELQRYESDMVISRIFRNLIRPVNLFGQHQSSNLMRKHKVTQFDAFAFLPQFFAKSIRTANGNYQIPPAMIEFLLNPLAEFRRSIRFSAFIAQNQRIGRLDFLQQRLTFQHLLLLW